MPHTLHAVPDIIVDAVAGYSGQSLCDVFVQQLCKHLAAECVLLTTLDNTQSLLNVQASSGNLAEQHPDVLLVHSSPFTHALKNQICVIEHNAAQQFPSVEILQLYQAEGVLAVSLPTDENNVIGLCIALYQKPLPKEYKGEHLMSLLSGFIAQELDRQGRGAPSDSLPKTYQHETNEMRYKGLIGTWSIEFPSRKLIWSEATFRLFDLEPFSCSLNLFELEQFIVPSDRAMVMLELEKVIEGAVAEPHVFEYRIVSAKGESKWLRAQVNSIRGEHQTLLQLNGITQDITRSKLTGNVLLEKYFDSLIRHLPLAAMQLKHDGSIDRVNEAALQLFGYRPEDVPLLHIDDLSFPQDKANAASLYRSLLSGDTEHAKVRKRYVTKLGQVIHSDASVIALRNDQGDIACYLAIVEPINDNPLQIDHLDDLTLLPSRAGFLSALDRQIKTNAHFALLQLGLDKFKSINNTQKIATGDALLTLVAERLKGRLRQQDFIARLGGDEFVIIVPDLVSKGQAEVFAQQLLGSFSQGFQLTDQQLYITASIGCVLFPQHGFSSDELMQKAGLALSEAKNQGRNTCIVYEQAMRQSELDKQALLVELTEAIKSGQLTVFYQPIIDNFTGKVAKLEALVRWQHPKRGFISPMVFVPLAEEVGLIQQLGQQVLRQACLQVKQLHHLGYEHLEVCINRSTLEFQNVDLQASEWIKVIQESGLPASSVTLEITESLLMNSDSQHMQRITALKAVGINIAIDDFGTGYSSLNYLRSLPADVVKIDRSFIADIPCNQQDNLLFNGIINIVHNLGMKVVVEGVETELQQNYIQQQGCDFSQGFLLSKPLSFDMLKDFLAVQFRQYSVGLM
ncbi:EAL domain-containing protein [Motilimonas cestriensis]|uniref:EAL domain-containing protein n=1 Tax=Motilimonas cestriensis TaxID=2742685 RepID=A0ABS8WDN7_9GAMM|nr:GGDEF domain-containing phosphodiesterase [Motilimonas cestriensis]MCE2595866.1 EAL domain-containing protein [Motilimonas cestriensis]